MTLCVSRVSRHGRPQKFSQVGKRLPIMRKGSKRARTGPTLGEKGPLLGEQSIEKDEGEMMKFLLIFSGWGGGGGRASTLTPLRAPMCRVRRR